MATQAAPNWPITLTTSRLLLRKPETRDFGHFERLWTDPDVREFLGGPVDETKIPARQRSLLDLPYHFSVLAGEDFVGTVSIDSASRFEHRREVSFSFLPEHWGYGYAREALSTVIDWAFGAVPSPNPAIIAVTQEANTRSRDLLEAVGMSAIERFVEFDEPQAMYTISSEIKSPGKMPNGERFTR